MFPLDDLKPDAAVRGILPDGAVTVVNVPWFGSEALELTYKTVAGKGANEMLYRHDEPRLDIVEQGRSWSFDGGARGAPARQAGHPGETPGGTRRAERPLASAASARSARIHPGRHDDAFL